LKTQALYPEEQTPHCKPSSWATMGGFDQREHKALEELTKCRVQLEVELST